MRETAYIWRHARCWDQRIGANTAKHLIETKDRANHNKSSDGLTYSCIDLLFNLSLLPWSHESSS
jgi:hypothetical protein